MVFHSLAAGEDYTTVAFLGCFFLSLYGGLLFNTTTRNGGALISRVAFGCLDLVHLP